MPKDTFDLPVIGRAAEVLPASVNIEARTVEVCWTAGAIVQRARFVGWDGIEFYDEELSVDPEHLRLDRLNSGAPFLDSHGTWNLSDVLGVVVDGSVRLEGGRGYATIRFSERADVEPIWQDVRSGIIRNVSVGYRVHEYTITQREGERDHYLATDWEPLEISAVAIGADPEAQVRGDEPRRRAPNPCVLTRQDGTPSPATTTGGQTMPRNQNQAAAGEAERQDTGTAATGAAETTATGTTGTGTTTERSQAPASERQAEGASERDSAPTQERQAQPDANAIRAEERRRVAEITRLCRRHGFDGDFADDLVSRGVSLDEARTEVLDRLADDDPLEGRSYEPAAARPRDTGAREIAYRDAVTGALMHRYRPSENPIDDNAREFRGLSLIEMARHSLERMGTNTRGMSRMELAGAVFQQRGAVGYHSTSDFAAILANVAGKSLRSAYESTPRTFAAWARRATITDFKPVSRVQLGGAPDLEKVLESGEFQYGSIGEGKEEYALASYGRIVAVTRQTLINDDLDGFTRFPAAFGASAADLESDIVYSILLENPDMADGIALFHADHGNLAGTASVVSEASLSTAYRAFGQQSGLEGRLISILPRWILVPPGSRSVEARKQVTSTTPSNTGDVNTYAGRLEVVEEPRLIPAAGEDPWFLAADPARIDTVEFAYLEGQEGVYTETRMGFEVDGLEIKARHDFAAKAIDHRGLYKNAGAAPV